MHVAPADEQDRARVDELARAVQEAPERAWSRPSGKLRLHGRRARRSGGGARHPSGGGQAGCGAAVDLPTEPARGREFREQGVWRAKAWGIVVPRRKGFERP